MCVCGSSIIAGWQQSQQQLRRFVAACAAIAGREAGQYVAASTAAVVSGGSSAAGSLPHSGENGSLPAGVAAAQASGLGAVRVAATVVGVAETALQGVLDSRLPPPPPLPPQPSCGEEEEGRVCRIPGGWVGGWVGG